MRASRIKIKNFRGIKEATVLLTKHAVLIGDNNTGKTTVLEALDLALGPDRINRQPPIDEHDFFRGEYLSTDLARGGVIDTEVDQDGETAEENTIASHSDASVEDERIRIEIEVTIVDLGPDQKTTFFDHLEFWNAATDALYERGDSATIDDPSVTEALRVTFRGWYDPDEDDFEGRTYFSRSLEEGVKPDPFTKKHKQMCGFLYLRSLRTGSRALSLERGSLLDIILRLRAVRPQLWEGTIQTLSELAIASDDSHGISSVLKSINTSLKKYVPKEWGIEPQLKVSSLTREHLRKIVTAFIATGDGDHSAPFYRQGTGTINMLVLALLSQIAEEKQNVIFAMEEPETAIPPYAQKRIVHEIRALAAQALFTSHSPFVLEEFTLDETIVLARDSRGRLSQSPIDLPPSIKSKRYRQEFRTRFCEGLLARRVLVAEGATEASAFPVVCRRLSELNPDTYSSLEALGVCTVDAGSETNIPDLAQLYRRLGKRTFAICDKQESLNAVRITQHVDLMLMHQEKGFENLVLRNTTTAALERFTTVVDWPTHISNKYVDMKANATAALIEYFSWSKANWGIADFLYQCSEDEIPKWLRDSCVQLKLVCERQEMVDAEGSESAEVPAATPEEIGH